MFDFKKLRISKKSTDIILKGVSSFDERVWEATEKEIITEAIKRNIDREVLLDAFKNNLIGKRIHASISTKGSFDSQFNFLWETTRKEYEEFRKNDRETLESFWDIKVIKAEVIQAENPLYLLYLNSHGIIECSTRELMYQGSFLIKFLSQFHRKLEPLDKESWARLTAYWLENLEKIESPMASRSGDIDEYLNEFVTEVSDDEKEQLARLRLGEVVEYENGIAFRLESFKKYLEKMKVSTNKTLLFKVLRGNGWKPTLIGPEAERMRCWWKEVEKAKEEPKDVDTLLKTDDSFNP